MGLGVYALLISPSENETKVVIVKRGHQESHMHTHARTTQPSPRHDPFNSVWATNTRWLNLQHMEGKLLETLIAGTESFNGLLEKNIPAQRAFLKGSLVSVQQQSPYFFPPLLLTLIALTAVFDVEQR